MRDLPARARSSTHGRRTRVVRARIGIHTGAAERTADNYVGLEVHRAARIGAAANGGQILVSRAAVRLLGETIAGRLAHRGSRLVRAQGARSGRGAAPAHRTGAARRSARTAGARDEVGTPAEAPHRARRPRRGGRAGLQAARTARHPARHAHRAGRNRKDATRRRERRARGRRLPRRRVLRLARRHAHDGSGRRRASHRHSGCAAKARAHSSRPSRIDSRPVGHCSSSTTSSR